MNYTLRFDEPLASRPEFTGGKGANLALLTAGGFPGPQGFTVIAPAYRAWLDTAPWWRDTVQALPLENPAALATTAAKMRDRLRTVPLPESLVAEIRAAIGQFPPGTCFAVRSSSTMEDLASAAFAGQHDTFLNCCDAASVLTALRDCYLSAWHDRVIAYRHQHGFEHAAASMAVVVQEMVCCDAAGVAFSANPVTGDLTLAVIEANYGLGESVVAGICEVDHYEVEKDTGIVRTRNTARKTMRTVCVAGGGTVDEAITGDDCEAPVLTDAQIASITEMLRRTEAWFRFPQDIEWGFAEDRLVVLQSRPITTIPPRWTRDESAERFPNVVTPLTWDFVDSGFRRSMNYSFRLMNFPSFSGQWFGKHGHYIYGNQNAVDIYSRRFPFALDSLADLPALIPRLREEFRWVQDLPVHWSRDLDYYLIRLGEFMAEPLEDKCLSGLWRFVQDINNHGVQYFLPNIAISVTQGLLFRLLNFLIRELFGPEEVAPVMDGLLSFCETKTGTINKELYELAQLVRHEPALEQHLCGASGSKALWDSGVLEIEHTTFFRRFMRFLRDHGHRELDFDPYHATWIEVPWVVLDQIRLILNAPPGLAPALRERELKIRSQAAEFSLFKRLPADLHFFMHEIVRLARLYTSLDDLEHYQTTRLALPLRKGLRALGERLTERGVLAEPMDIFFARETEITAAIAADSPLKWWEFSAGVAAAKASWDQARGRSPGWVPDITAPEAVAPHSGSEMSGLPGSPGVADGEVFIVSGPQDFATFPRGAILVARTTNPAWTPLFYTARAIITESGGPLSHGAVTAREMRIPAVMSVRDCLTRLAPGCRVHVDGGRGKVLLTQSAPPADRTIVARNGFDPPLHN